MLTLLRKHLANARYHPISIICRIFREQFGSAYEKYAKPKKNEKGVLDKVGVLQEYKARNSELKIQFKLEIISSSE